MDDRDVVLGNLVQAVNMIEKEKSICHLIPEIRTNIVYALPLASTIEDVAGIKGRITVVDGKPRACGYPDFGASSHLARLILALMKTDSSKRAALNLKYDETLHKLLSDYCEVKGILMAVVDRSKEPLEVKNVEGQSMKWLAEQFVNSCYGKVPTIACTYGGEGKEPVTIIIGENPVQVAKIAIDISQIKSVAKTEKPSGETVEKSVEPVAEKGKSLEASDLFDDLQGISKKPKDEGFSTDWNF